jgi:hypothetical protein
MKLAFKFKNTEHLSIGMPVYKDDTEIGKILASIMKRKKY